MAKESTKSPQGFERLIRVVAADGKTYYGDAVLPASTTDLAKTKEARVIEGDIFGKHQVTDELLVRVSAPFNLSQPKYARWMDVGGSTIIMPIRIWALPLD